MKKRHLLSLALLPIFAYGNEKKESRPNIVLFLVDDMGWQDTSVPFWKERTPLNDRYETPNMEKLAEQGIKFTQAYACSVSSPSRISLMTGMNAARHRVTNWTLYKNRSTDGSSNLFTYPDWNVNGICEEPNIERTCQVTALPRLLQQNGYHTIHCGKAHFGAIDTPGADPKRLGFDVNIAGHAAGGLASYLGEKHFGNRTDGKPSSPFAIPGLEKYHGQNIFVTEALTREALSALDSARELDKPFFLYMSHYAVHIPIDRDHRYYQKYIDKGLTPTEAAYAGLIEGMDKSLGDILDYLKQNGLEENTVVLFMSDNGGLAASNRDGKLHVQNAPLNSGKGSAYEGGIREPMIVKWPGIVAAGTSCDQYIMIEDFYPTLLELAGVKEAVTRQPIDGESFVPLLKGKKSLDRNRPLYWHFPNCWGPTGPGIGETSAIRQGDWKLIYYYLDGHFELFNLRNDIGETRNVAPQEPKRVKKMARRLSDYLRSVNAQRPTYKATGQLAPWPDEKLQ